MRVAAVQLDVRRGDSAANLAAAEAALREARGAGVQLALLPELWASSFPTGVEDLAERIRADRAAVERLADFSRELDLAVGGSALAPSDDPERPFNRFELFDRGARVLVHDKVHLFTPTAEHLAFTAGAAAPPVGEVRGVLVAPLVCYDLRFPELARAAFRAGAELFLVPAQWPTPRAGHLRALAAGLAVQCQASVLTCNRSGVERVGRRALELYFPGRSLALAADGTLLAEGPAEAALVVADLPVDLPRSLRREVPVLRDERRDLHPRWTDA